MNDYTLVIGVDKNHLTQLELVVPTWRKHKPSIFRRRIIIFYDYSDVYDFQRLFPNTDLSIVPWPPAGVSYHTQQPRVVAQPHENALQAGGPSNTALQQSPPVKPRFYDSQRYKMLSGFVHVPARYVTTPYWLKLDLDAVAFGQDDWVQRDWVDGTWDIVSHRWGYTKPPDQMMLLDQWADKNHVGFAQPPLNLVPEPGSSIVKHPRIISWCAFFRTEFTKRCSRVAERTCGRAQLPVPSQDGFMFYCALRWGLKVLRTNMKNHGWEHWSSTKNVRKAVERSL